MERVSPFVCRSNVVFERRYPVILREFSLRTGSGGRGKYAGGDGVVRDIEFRIPCQVSILSERRVFRPYGLHGGEDGEYFLDRRH
jgi:5-oxoprolinase (ATP-hydrolysing)